MKRKFFFLILLCVCVYLGAVSAHATERESFLQWEYLLEKPAWGVIEWNSATLPKGFWYPTFEFLYLSNGSYFSEGKEVDYKGGRDSTCYMLTGSFLYGLSNKLTAGVCIPVVLDQKVDSGLYGKGERVSSGVSNVGDIELFLKYRIVDRYFWSLAAEFGPTLPTGKSHNKAAAGKAGTGDGQTDLNFVVKGDILLTEDAFVKLGTGFTYQFKREYRDQEGTLIDEKLGNVFEAEAGVVRNFKNVGLGGALQYTFWGATKWNDEVKLGHADLFNLSLHLSLGELTPRRQGKFDLTFDFPITGTNAPVTYRYGISIKSIFQ